MNDLKFPRNYKITEIGFKRTGKLNNALTMEEIDNFLEKLPPQRKSQALIYIWIISDIHGTGNLKIQALLNQRMATSQFIL